MSNPTATPRRSLEQLHVPDPCPASWEQMRDDGGGRHYCATCSKHVHDLSALASEEAESLLASAGEAGRSICVRFERRPNGTILTRETSHRRPVFGMATRWRRAVAMLATTLGVSSPLSFISGCGRSDSVATRWLDRVLQSYLHDDPPAVRMAGTVPVMMGAAAPPPLPPSQIVQGETDVTNPPDATTRPTTGPTSQPTDVAD